MKDLFIKMIAGTVARGLLWGFGLLAQYIAVGLPSEEAAARVGLVVAGLIFEGFATMWSSVKDAKLIDRYFPRWLAVWVQSQDAETKFKKVAEDIFVIEKDAPAEGSIGGA
jgi:hypothetical protein